MKRLPWIITAAALCAVTLSADASPKKASPNPSTGPVLQITFTGLVVFRQNGKGYRVVLPERKDNGHVAFILFPKEDAFTDVPVTDFECQGAYRWIRLEGDRLTLDTGKLVAPLFTEPPDLSGWLVHLSSLARGNQFNDLDYNQASPKPKNVAAQIDVNRGTLEPAVDTPPQEWEFKTEDGQTSGVSICGVSGTNWSLPLTPGTREIAVRSSRMRNPILTLRNLSDGETRTLTIGNSRTEDIDSCRPKPMANEDPDFKIHYLVLKGKVDKEFMPVKLDPRKPCNPKTGPGEPKRSLRGSDCMGGQWP
jgi:hypothetical protein